MQSTKLEVDANELMERIRREAGKTAADWRGGASDFDLMSEPSGKVVPGPSADQLQPPLLKLEKLGELVQLARQKLEVSPRIPKLFSRLFRKQGGYNRAMVETAALLVRTSEQLQKHAVDVAAYLDAQNRWLEALALARAKDHAWIAAATDELENLRKRVDELNRGKDPAMSSRAREDGEGLTRGDG